MLSRSLVSIRTKTGICTLTSLMLKVQKERLLINELIGSVVLFGNEKGMES
jgi:hypothetical protein